MPNKRKVIVGQQYFSFTQAAEHLEMKPATFRHYYYVKKAITPMKKSGVNIFTKKQLEKFADGNRQTDFVPDETEVLTTKEAAQYISKRSWPITMNALLQHMYILGTIEYHSCGAINLIEVKEAERFANERRKQGQHINKDKEESAYGMAG